MSETHTHNSQDWDEETEGHVHDHPARPAYFSLNEIVLRVEHSDALIDWNKWIQTLNGRRELRRHPFRLELVTYEGDESSDKDYPNNLPPYLISRVPSQEQGRGRAHSTILARLAGDVSPKRLSLENWKETDQVIIDLVNDLNNERFKRSFDDSDTVLETVSPNWLFCGAPHGFGDGGPGGWPVPLSAADVQAQGYEIDLKYLQDVIRQRCNGSGEVNVVILDTVQPKQRIDKFLKQQPHELLEALTERLHIIRASRLNIPLPPDPISNPHDEHHYIHKDEYFMADHGLFIAGIIHSLAKEANIYLVEVLNRYGVCTLTGLLRALQAITDGVVIQSENPSATRVINLSLCIGFSSNAVLWNGEIPERLILPFHSNSNQGMWRPPAIIDNPAMALASIRSALDQLRLSSPGPVRIVAAAGNDGIQGNQPPSARFPAAFPHIVGVGALEDDGTRAWYSNTADLPAQEGLLVLGGKATRQVGQSHTITDQLGGVIGIYIGKFPDGTRSTSGWARWSGTSFATAIMSGAFARAAQRGCDISENGSSGDIYVRFQAQAPTTSSSGEPMSRTPQP